MEAVVCTGDLENQAIISFYSMLTVQWYIGGKTETELIGWGWYEITGAFLQKAIYANAVGCNFV